MTILPSSSFAQLGTCPINIPATGTTTPDRHFAMATDHKSGRSANSRQIQLRAEATDVELGLASTGTAADAKVGKAMVNSLQPDFERGSGTG